VNKSALEFALALAACLAATLAQAQAYRCSNGATVYYSDRPCGGPPPTKLGAYGGSRSTAQPSYAPQQPRAGKMQDHVKYLSPACADISEAIRTAPARGLRGDVVSQLHEEYRDKCLIEDQDARRQQQQDDQQAHRQKLAQRDSAANERNQSQQRAEQCTGMRDVIALKRSRESRLNETEVAALRSLESTYNARCIAR
jgi:hypothetical protein